jgi:hypothetical protein
MVHFASSVVARRCIAAVLVGGLIGGFLGFASATAQVAESGWLDAECSKSCATNGYDPTFCGDVCWVPDPAKVAETENVDWKCAGRCTERGGKARDCLARCR